MTTLDAPRAASGRMTLWRLELARLRRTHRWLIVFGVYAFFGVVSPITARYLSEIMARFGEGMTVVVPDPRPADAFVQLVGATSQICLLAVVVVAASALTLDARPEVAAFLRTKVTRPGSLVLPPYIVTTVAAVAGLAVGTALTWLLTISLIGAVPVGAVLIGTVYGAVYLAFAVSVVAVVAGYARSQATTVFGGLGALLAFPFLSILRPLQPWLPSELLAAVAAMVEGAPASDFARAFAVALLATAGFVYWAVRRFAQREL